MNLAQPTPSIQRGDLTMQTAPKLENAKQFANHRELVAAIIPLNEAGEIDGYSIHKHPASGYAAGVRVNDAWGFLA